jgi:hypothetical protein
MTKPPFAFTPEEAVALDAFITAITTALDGALPLMNAALERTGIDKKADLMTSPDLMVGAALSKIISAHQDVRLMLVIGQHQLRLKHEVDKHRAELQAKATVADLKSQIQREL